MKPFNLEAAKAGAPVVTKSGKKVRILCFDRKQYANWRIIALVEDENGEERVLVYKTDGSYQTSSTGYDLVMTPVKKEGYTIIYPPEHWRGKGVIAENGLIFETLEDAEWQRGSQSHLPIVKVEWEE